MLRMKYLFFLFLPALLLSLADPAKAQDDLPIDLVSFCSGQKGFNLLGKFDVSWSNNGFSQVEFELIRELGFNFVRLPLDYRTYTRAGNWNEFLENEISEIDDAVRWGQENGVHVCINLHRAPGYCVNSVELPANQDLDLWTDATAQDAFLLHWKFFAERYRDIAPELLSFNLVNEPSNVSEAMYLAVMNRAIDTIHRISPGRIIFVDGLNYGRDIIASLKDEPNIAQSLHTYDPFTLSHYKAEWVNGADLYPMPRWPMLWISCYLYGPWKTEFKSPLVLEGIFPKGTEVRVNVRQVSIESTLQVKANTKVVYTKKFVCTADTGDDFSMVINTQWGYQNISNKDFSYTLTEDATILSFENTSGDWMTLNSVTLVDGTSSYTYILSDDTWGRKQDSYKIDAQGAIKAMDGSDLLPFGNYKNNLDIAKQYNIPLMVQEFGVYNKTPHTVTIGFLTDLVGFFHQNNIGYALWNFTGSFGILNSDREDCVYESYKGYKLDREMLNALTIPFVNQDTPEVNTGRLLLFFNPVDHYLSLSNNPFQGSFRFEIYDLMGRLVKSGNYLKTGEPSLIDVRQLNSGMYILFAADQRGHYSEKFLLP